MSSLTADQREASAPTLEVCPVGGKLGAEIHGAVLSGQLPERTINEIKEALWKYKVLFFRDQKHLDDASHQAFTERLGPLWITTTAPDAYTAKMGGFFDLDADAPGGRADNWHTDSTFIVDPPAISVLRALRLPQRVVDTAWADTAAGYQALPDEFKALADKLWARHASKLDISAVSPNATPQQIRYFDGMTPGKMSISHHPLVFVHPHSGERCLLIRHNPRILGFSQSLSNVVIQIMQDHITNIHNTVRWRWREGDVAMWDNLATQHVAINDYGDLPRHMRRLTVQGVPLTSVDGRRSVAVQKAGE